MRRNTDAKTPKAYHQWFARAFHTETVTLADLAAVMQSNSTVKKSDILAVLCELSDAMRHELQAGRKVSIDGLGTFMLGLSSNGVEQPGRFRADRDLRDVHVVFQPETRHAPDGSLCQTMAAGTHVAPLPVRKTK